MTERDDKLSLANALPKLSGKYNGEVLLVPTAKSIAEAVGKRALTRGPYIEQVEAASGLSVIHNGIVLGDPSLYIPPEGLHGHLESLAAEITALPDNLRARVIEMLEKRTDETN